MGDLLRIDTLGSQGDGVTADGIYVPGALPGETVRAKISGHRAQLVDVVDPAADRVTPPCPHFGKCGGCALQHASDGLVEQWKQDLVTRALSARGIENVSMRPTLTSPPRSRRRVTFAGKRTKKGSLVGFHAAASDEIIPLSECVVATPGIMKALPILGSVVELAASRKGVLRLSVTETDAGLDLAVVGGKPLEGAIYGELVAIAATSDLARLSWDGEVVVTRRAPVLNMGSGPVTLPPGGFLQATRDGEAALVAGVLEILAGARRVADLFCGVGTFALPLAETAEVSAFEADQEACEMLDAAWRLQPGLKPLKVQARDLFRRPLLAHEFKGMDAAVIDPPRQGARAQCEQIAASDVPKIAMVSCNPATFARDARSLIDAGYTIDWVQTVDQFRWSAHVELVAAFTRG